METFSQDDPVSGLDIGVADDALEHLLVRDQVEVVQLLVRSQTVSLKFNIVIQIFFNFCSFFADIITVFLIPSVMVIFVRIG